MTHRIHGPMPGPSYKINWKEATTIKLLPSTQERDRNRKWQALERARHPDVFMEAKSRNLAWRTERKVRQSRRRRKKR